MSLVDFCKASFSVGIRSFMSRLVATVVVAIVVVLVIAFTRVELFVTAFF